MKRLCIDCGKPTEGTRCKPCDRPRQQEHTRKANQRYATTEYKTNRARCLDRDGHRCRKCGTPKNLTAHHIIPKWDGGTDALGNLITLCQSHNRQADIAYREGVGGQKSLRPSAPN